MRLGISSYTYVWAAGVPGYPAPERPLTPEGLLDKAIELGVRIVQIADNLPLDRLSETSLDTLLGRASEAGIELELGTCGIEPDNLRQYLRQATRLKSSILRTVIDTPEKRSTVLETVQTLAPLMAEFEQAGIDLALENHDRFDAATLKSVLDQVNSPALGICLDTANSIGCVENVTTLLSVLGPKVLNLHIKDFVVFRPGHKKGFVIEGRPAGQGQLDIPTILASLRELGREVNAIVELWPAPEDTLTASIAKENDWARQSVHYLRQFISD